MRDKYYLTACAVKTFAILEYLCAHGEQGVSELSRALKLNKSFTHRSLATLEHLGYLRQTPPKGAYVPTLRIFNLASQVPALVLPIQIIHPFLEELSRQFRETINLAVLDGGGVVYIDKVESSETLRMDLAVGRKVPAHCTALGKVLLANLPVDSLRQVLKQGLTRYTKKTITDEKKYEEELGKIKRLGYAIDDEELNLGVRCIAVPLYSYKERAVAAISIAGPSVRMTVRNLKQLVQPLKNASRRISYQLGAHRRPDD
jgi:DNA-binding IclR family transcriptional regulator